MTTTVLGRLLLHLRRTECRPPSALPSLPSLPSPGASSIATTDVEEDAWDARRRSRAISPFGLVPLAKHMSAYSAHSAHSQLSDAGLHLHVDSYDDVIHIAPPYHYQKRVHDPSE